MIKILIGSLFTALVIILIVLGLVNYNSRYSDTPDKDKFSFLNQFPYELQDNPTMKYNLIFKIFASLVGASYAVFGMYLFFFVDPYPYTFKNITEIVLGIIFIVIGVNIFFEFNISLKNYKLHLITSSSLFALTVCNYVLVGYYILFNGYVLVEASNQFPIALSYVLFVIAAGLLASLIFTPLKKWMYLEKEEKDGTVRYYRKRISILPIMEWIFLLSNVLLIILLTIF